jgi:hypothetical protein
MELWQPFLYRGLNTLDRGQAIQTTYTTTLVEDSENDMFENYLGFWVALKSVE